ncbi:MAG TPA: hypothetical protein VHJ37_08085 [Thermoleophilaceae bacterium]|jgi:hypothetical protein|nr:hypothetical protein [Thermoleophilaceae bacterium]
MPGLRILLRIAPFFVGVLAAAVWLRRRRIERTPLPAAPVPRVLEPSPEPVVAVSAEPAAAPREPGEPEPISIVTVVDDLLEIGR